MEREEPETAAAPDPSDTGPRLPGQWGAGAGAPGRTALRWYDWLAAGGILVAVVATLWSTSQMGFTRDESFYFRYAGIYQDWFSRAADGPRVTAGAAGHDPAGANAAGEEATDPMGRHDVVSTFSQNFEHPPLMKTLFGLSWRLFADKRRRLDVLREDPGTPGAVLGQVVGLTESEGFAVGDSVRLLSPMPVDGDRSDSARHFATAEVVEREPNRAVVRIPEATPEGVRSACAAPEPEDRRAPSPWITPCQASSSGPLQVTSEHTALRFPAWVFAGALIALLYLFGTELFGRWAGLFAAAVFLFAPRPFFHSHLCSFDVPVTTLVVATVYAFWRSLRSRRWAVACGVVFGLSLLTKLNAFFIPIPLLAAWLLAPAIESGSRRLAALREHGLARPPLRRVLLHIGAGAATAAASIGAGLVAGVVVALLWATLAGAVIRLPPIPKAFLWMPPVGLVMLFGLWPRMWYDPARAFSDYVGFHVGHVHYLQEYFGNILAQPPFPPSYPWVMTLLTVPVMFLALFAVGSVTLFLTDRGRVGLFDRLLVAANFLFPIGLISLPGTPIFGGVKHWLVTHAFLGLVAGYGFDWLRRRAVDRVLRGRAVRLIVAAAAAALFVAPGAVDSFRCVLFGTGYYNQLIGGVRGAADHRMQRKFWGYSGRYALEHVNRHAARGAMVSFHNTTWDAVELYRRDGLLRSDIHWRRDPPDNCREGDLYLFHHQESFAQDLIDAWDHMNNWVPDLVFAMDGVPMLTVYSCHDEPEPTPPRPASKPASSHPRRPRGSPPRER